MDGWKLCGHCGACGWALCLLSKGAPSPPPTLSSPIVCFASPAITPCAPVMHSWQVIQNFLQGLQQLLAKASSGPSCKSDCLHHFCVRQPTKAAHRYAKGQQLIAERKNQGEKKVCASACCAYVSGFSVVVVVFTGSTPCPSRGLFVVVLDAMGVETKASEFSSTGRGEGRERNVSKDK